MSTAASRDFSARTLRALSSKGIQIVSIMAIPAKGDDLMFCNSTRGYVLDDNGTHRIRSHSEVLALASGPCEMERALSEACARRAENERL